MSSTVLFHHVKGVGDDVIVLIPGLQADHRIWRAVLHFLSSQSRTVSVDNRGFGRSAFHGETISIDTMAQDVVHLMDLLSVRCFGLVGHSMGGAIAQQIAYQYPDRVRALALCNTFRSMRSLKLTAIAARLQAAPNAKVWADIQRQLLEDLFADGPLRRVVGTASFEKRDHRGRYIALQGLLQQVEALLAFDSTEWIASLKVPTLIVDSAGDRQLFSSEAAQLARGIAKSRRVTLPGGHASTIEQWRPLGRLLTTFFKESATAVSLCQRDLFTSGLGRGPPLPTAESG